MDVQEYSKKKWQKQDLKLGFLAPRHLLDAGKSKNLELLSQNIRQRSAYVSVAEERLSRKQVLP